MQCSPLSFRENVMPYLKRQGVPSNRQKVKLWFQHLKNVGDFPSGQRQLHLGGFSTLVRNVAENLKCTFAVKMSLCNPAGLGRGPTDSAVGK